MRQTKHWLVTAALLLCSISVSAHDFEVDGIYYKITDAANLTVEVTFRGSSQYTYSGEYSGVVTIPETIKYNDEEYSVTSIADDAFYACADLTKVVIPKSVVSIGDDAFFECSSLTNVSMAEGITTIGAGAFIRCTSLSSITMPNSIVSVGYGAFAGCSRLTGVYIKSLSAWCNIDFHSKDANPLYCAKVLYLGYSVLEDVEIPNNITEIKKYSFINCALLQSVIMGENITKIEESAFEDCVTLSNLTMSKNVTYIGDEAFRGCSELTNLVLPEKLKTIRFFAFYGCGKITSLTIPSSVTSIGAYAFSNWVGLKDLCIEDGEEHLCCNLTPSATFTYEDWFFEDSPIENLYVGRNLSGYTFSYVYGDWRSTLRTVEIGNGMTSIPNYMFDSCSKLSSVTISDNVEIIGGATFYACVFSNIQLPGNLKTIGPSAFQQSKLKNIQIPQSVTSIGDAAFHYCLELDGIVVEEGNSIYDSREGCNAIIETSTNMLLRGCNNTVIPDGIVGISKNAFAGCPDLTSLTMPKTLNSIGDWGFQGCCKLSSVTLPQGVTSIGDGAFSLCNALTSITCEAKTPPVIGGANTFYDVARNIPIYVPESSVSAYKSAEYWSEFTNFQAIPEINISLTDGEDFSQSESEECDNIFYTRTFNNTNWQALYVPFEIPYDNIKDDFEVAYINDTRQYDRDDDGVKEETVIEAFKITSGTLEANYPYLIRAKEAGENTITVTDAILYATEENSIDCSSVYDKYIFTGTYSRMSSTELTGCYALSGGVWQPIAEGATLGAFRFYLQVESRSGSAQAAQSIKMRVIGEEIDDEATSIDEVESADNEQIVYDLAGRRVANPTKGVYIVNGKKMLYN